MSTGSSPLHEQALTAVSALDTTHAGIYAAGYTLLRMLVIGSAGVASGAVLLEGAHTKDYAGAWAAVIAAQTVVADTVVSAASTANAGYPYVRARISTVLAGGTVTVVIVGN